MICRWCDREIKPTLSGKISPKEKDIHTNWMAFIQGDPSWYSFYCQSAPIKRINIPDDIGVGTVMVEVFPGHEPSDKDIEKSLDIIYELSNS